MSRTKLAHITNIVDRNKGRNIGKTKLIGNAGDGVSAFYRVVLEGNRLAKADFCQRDFLSINSNISVGIHLVFTHKGKARHGRIKDCQLLGRQKGEVYRTGNAGKIARKISQS